MKKTLIVLLLPLLSATASFAQNSKLTGLLDNYLAIKNALVAGDATKASAGAATLQNAANAVSIKTLSADEQKAFPPLQSKITADAKLIAESKDINKQRETFASLSDNMIALAKAAKLSDKDVFVQYCPMKKASWLSAEQAIKNPYYGSAMLTCGNVKETIK